jgi:hypothetical protein
MSPKRMFGMLLIVLGIAAFAYEGINYRTREESFQLGNLHVTTEKTHHIPLSPIAGAAAVAMGIYLMAIDVKKLVPAGARS